MLRGVKPIWAELIAQDVPDVEDVQNLLWEHASLPLDWFPVEHRASIEALGRVQPTGRVHLTKEVDEVLLMTAGGLGSLHAAARHSWGATRAQTRPVT